MAVADSSTHDPTPRGGSAAPTSFTTRAIPATQTHDLRHSILRPDGDLSDVDFSGDDDPDTMHAGTFDGERLVAIASVYRESRSADAAGGAPGVAERDADTTWRLRGMASVPEVRGSGAGAAALAAVEAHARANGGTLLWCNARTPAVGFYERMGWTVVGTHEFDIPQAGPHHVMERRLD